jgi:hypothetical protein
MAWSASAAGAVPYYNAIQADMYNNANGRLRFKDEKTGTMNFVFNVTHEAPEDFDHLRITYRNAFKGSPWRVSAVLKRVNISTGNITNLVGISSEDIAQNEEDEIVNVKSVAIPDGPLDFNSNFFYIVATLSRGNTEQNPTLLGVGLVGGVS